MTQLVKTSDSEAYDDEDESSDSGDAMSAMPHSSTDLAKSTIFSSRGSGVPLRRRTGYDYPPTWLRSHSQIYAKPAHLHLDSIGLHILDQGYGPNALLTVRQIDSEKQQKRFTLEQQSRTGVLGRIISGVWVKVAEVKHGILSFILFLFVCFDIRCCRYVMLLTSTPIVRRFSSLGDDAGQKHWRSRGAH